MNGERGQATVELVGLLPLLLAVGFAAFSVLSAGAASEAAGAAAEAGAIALLQGRDAEAAARASLAGRAPRDTTITIRDRAVTVHIVPRGLVRALDDRLAATTTAHAGAPAR